MISRIFNAKRYIIGVTLVSLLLSIVPPSAVQALNGQYDETFFSNNDILYYNPEDTACGTTGSASLGSLKGKTNREKIYNFWITQGLTPAQAAGITSSLQFEGGFSPFRQEDTKTWPDGGWGIAQFTADQRKDATDHVLKEVGAAMFNEYYKNDFGRTVAESSGFVPTNVPIAVNDKFLLAELNYLVQYVGSFAPGTIPTRVTQLKTDYNISIETTTKLLDFIKTLKSAGDVAETWTYLYEYPSNIKGTAAQRSITAEALLTKLTDSAAGSGDQCGVVGIGGLTYEQAKAFMKDYYDNRRPFLSNFWLQKNQSIQCTTLIYYFNTRFVVNGTGSGHGWKVAKNLIDNFPSAYKSVDKDSIQPFSVFSYGTSSPGHTGMILGLGDDGSIIIGEANATIGNKAGLLEIERTGSKSDQTKGLVTAEKWESIEAWTKTLPAGLTIAAPVDGAGVASKVADSLNGTGATN